MFVILAIIFVLFTLFFGLLTAAIIYHLRQYTLPKQFLPRWMLALFLFFSTALWLLALYFLFKVPRF